MRMRMRIQMTIGVVGRKSNGPQVQLKKRGKDRDDDQGSRDDEEGGDGSGRGDDSDVRSDLCKDLDDRQQLIQLIKLERKLIVSDQAMKLDDKKFHERVKSWMNDSKPQLKSESIPSRCITEAHRQ